MLHQRLQEECYINLNPLQRGGATTAAVRMAASFYLDGYSVCDACKGVLHLVEKPPISSLKEELAQFLGMDTARIVHGAREGKFLVFHALLEEGDVIVMDQNRHYTSYVAAERVRAQVYFVPSTGYPQFEITPQAYEETIKRVIKEKGKPPKLALLTHVDGEYGNLTDAASVAKICKEFDVPFLLNCAYSAGRMRIDGGALGADFLVCSCHKSFATPGTVGVLACKKEWDDALYRLSSLYKKKEVELLGCTVRSQSIVALMAALPYVKERVKNWPEEVKKARWFVERMESFEGIRQLGKRPKEHDLIRLETPALSQIAKHHRKKGYFLYEELRNRGIVGIKPGQTEWFKLSVYGLSWSQLNYLVDAFKDIIKG